MVTLHIIYTHHGDPVYPHARRHTVKKMDEFMTNLVYDIKFAGISCKYESIEGEVNDVTVNGKRVNDILEELGDNILRANLDELGRPKTTSQVGRVAGEWNPECIEDITVNLMKNALSKAYADTRKPSDS